MQKLSVISEGKLASTHAFPYLPVTRFSPKRRLSTDTEFHVQQQVETLAAPLDAC